MPAWIGLIIEYAIIAWKDKYAAAKRFLKWLGWNKGEDIAQKTDTAERLDKEIDNEAKQSQ